MDRATDRAGAVLIGDGHEGECPEAEGRWVLLHKHAFAEREKPGQAYRTSSRMAWSMPSSVRGNMRSAEEVARNSAMDWV